MVAKVREGVAESRQAAEKFDVGRFNLRKRNEVEVKKKFQIENTNSFATFEYLSDSEDINRAWDNKKENIKTSAKDSLGLQTEAA